MVEWSQFITFASSRVHWCGSLWINVFKWSSTNPKGLPEGGVSTNVKTILLKTRKPFSCHVLCDGNVPYTHLEATSYIPQQGQSLPIWTTSLSTTGCYKNKYTIQCLWMACISRFSMAILSGETELALGTIRVKYNLRSNITVSMVSVSCSVNTIVTE